MKAFTQHSLHSRVYTQRLCSIIFLHHCLKTQHLTQFFRNYNFYTTQKIHRRVFTQCVFAASYTARHCTTRLLHKTCAQNVLKGEHLLNNCLFTQLVTAQLSHQWELGSWMPHKLSEASSRFYVAHSCPSSSPPHAFLRRDNTSVPLRRYLICFNRSS